MVEAISYALNQWEALNIYTCNGSLAINKTLLNGWPNWLIFGSNQGGKSLAILSSFTATYQQFGINPWIYLRDKLTQLAH